MTLLTPVEFSGLAIIVLMQAYTGIVLLVDWIARRRRAMADRPYKPVMRMVKNPGVSRGAWKL